MIWWICVLSHICMQIVLANQRLAMEATEAQLNNGSYMKGYIMDSKKPLKPQCRSTGYQKDFSWVPVKNRNRLVEEPRRFLKDLRNDMYKKADAEKCHQPEMRNVQEFLECQVRRHMRLELHIPKYPNVPT